MNENTISGMHSLQNILFLFQLDNKNAAALCLKLPAKQANEEKNAVACRQAIFKNATENDEHGRHSILEKKR